MKNKTQKGIFRIPRKYRKLNCITMGGKGGVGKTTLMSGLVEWFEDESIPFGLLDLDTENRTKGGLQHYYPQAQKVNVQARDGLEVFIDILDRAEAVVLADMGAGQGEAAMRWFTDAYEQAKEMGIGFLLIAVVTNDSESVSSLLQWAAELQDRVHYLVVLNEMDEPNSTFSYWTDPEPAQRFRETFRPAVMKLTSRSPVLQKQLADHGLTLRDVAERKTNVVELQKIRYVAQAERLRRQLATEFQRVILDFLPSGD